MRAVRESLVEVVGAYEIAGDRIGGFWRVPSLGCDGGWG